MKAAIFDFDGPIFDGRKASAAALRSTIEKFAKTAGVPSLNPSGLPLYNPAQLVGLAYAELKPSPEKLDEILIFYRNALQQEEKKVSLDPAIQSLIRLLRERNVELAIISSRETENLKTAIARLGLTNSFSYIQGRERGHDSKSDSIRQFLGPKFDPRDVIFVGDSDGDCAAAKEAGVRYYHTAWTGEPTGAAHTKADVKLDTVQDLLAVCQYLTIPSDQIALPDSLVKAVRTGQFAFYAGAGVSVPSGIGGWDKHYMPILRELKAGALLATYQLPELLQLLAANDERAFDVFDKFAKSFRGPSRANPYHHALLRSGAEHIWTTNYDQLFEQVIVSGDYPYLTVKNDEELVNNFGKQPMVIKMNGDFASAKYDKGLDWQLVFLQEQFDLAEKRRTEIWRLFEDDYRNRAMIFVGVSFRDPTLRRITAAAARNIPRTRFRHCLVTTLPQHPVEILEFTLFRDYLKRYYIDVLAFRTFEEIDRIVRKIAIMANRPIVGFSGTSSKNNRDEDVLGGGSINSKLIAGLCYTLGQSLARRGLRVSSGHGPGVGIPSVEAAFEADPSSARFYLRKRGTSHYSRTAPAIIVTEATLEAMRDRFIPECDLLFAAGGDSTDKNASGTIAEIKRAAELQIPVLILKQAGGDAAAYAQEYVASIDGNYPDRGFAAEIKRANSALHAQPVEQLENFFASELPELIENLIAAFIGSTTRRPRPAGGYRW